MNNNLSKKVRLLVPCDMGIGNLIMYLPALEKLKQSDHNVEMTMLLFNSSINYELIKSIAPNIFDDVLLINQGNKAVNIIHVLTRIKPNYIVIRFNSFSRWVVLLAILCRIICRTKILGHASSKYWQNKFDFILNYRVKVTSEHESKNYINLSKAFNDVIENSEMNNGQTSVRTINVMSLDQLKDIVPPENMKNLIIFNAGSSSFQDWKRWPEQHWSELVHGLSDKGFALAAVGSREDHNLHSLVLKRAHHAPCFNLSGRLSFLETVSLISHSALVIGADTAVLHLASLTNTPILGLFGPTDENRTSPMSGNFTLLRAPHCVGRCFTLSNPDGHKRCDALNCMQSLSPESVQLEALRLSSSKTSI